MERQRLRFALQFVGAGLFVRDRGIGGMPCRVGYEDTTWRGGRLDAGRGAPDAALKPPRSMNRTDTSRRSATGAARSSGATLVASGVPHSPQKRSVGSFAAPHAGHDTERATPQLAQNLRPGLFSVPQFVQVIPPPVDGRAYRLHGSPAPGPCTGVVQDAAVSIEPRDAVERVWREQ